jgi:ABC-2 type transport system ATP-binding protein
MTTSQDFTRSSSGANDLDVPAVQTRALVKRYGEVVALDALDLVVPRGAFFGLLGPNGAGKTTTLHVLCTLTRPTSGEARMLGHDVVRDRAAVRAEIGLVFQESTLDCELSARENLDIHARLYHLDDRRRRVEAILDLVGLAPEADRPVKTFSGGMKRRLEIARGLLHAPRILFLDEPTLGLDVRARRAIWDHLRRIRAERDLTIVLTTHYLEEADALCDTVGIIDHGRIATSGAPEDLKSALGGDAVRVALDRLDDASVALKRVEGVTSVEVGDGAARVTLAEGARRLPALLDAARPFGVREVTMHRPTLEDVFLHHTGHAFEADGEDAA